MNSMSRRGMLRGGAVILGASVGASRFTSGASSSPTTVVKVVGLGGAGNSVVERLAADGMAGVGLIAASTDAEALRRVNGPEKMLLGASVAKGHGCGGTPRIGRLAAMEDRPRIQWALSGARVVVVAAGMGGGMGTGAAPVVAQIANRLGIPTVGVVTTPFEIENRMRVAEEGIADLERHADRVLVTNCEDFLAHLGGCVTMEAVLDAVVDRQAARIRRIARLVVEWSGWRRV